MPRKRKLRTTTPKNNGPLTAADVYYRELSDVDLIDKVEEQELFQRYKEHNDLEARDRLVENCLRYVVLIAHRYWPDKDPDTLSNLIQAGNLGLMDALEKYDPSFGTRFLSYATFWVKQSIREELTELGVVKIPMWRHKAVNKVKNFKRRYAADHGTNPTKAVIEEALGKNTPSPEDTAFSYESLEVNDASQSITEDPCEQIQQDNLKSVVSDLLGELTIRERFILQSYFAFIGDEDCNLKQISSVCRLSPERVRQIKTSALDQLRVLLHERGITMEELDLTA